MLQIKDVFITDQETSRSQGGKKSVRKVRRKSEKSQGKSIYVWLVSIFFSNISVVTLNFLYFFFNCDDIFYSGSRTVRILS